MKKIIILLLLAILFSCITTSSDGYYEKDDILYYAGDMVTSISFQKNADIIRLRHLKYYTNLIQEYYTKTGSYPFQSEEPQYIYIANKEQEAFTNEYDSSIPYKHLTISFADFVKEIESTLNITVNEYYDPQYAPDIKPNWYLYASMNNNFYFAIHLHQSFDFSKNLAEYYNKVEISNVPNKGDNLILTTHELLESEQFKTLLNSDIEKEDFFKERENLHLHETKL